MVAREARFAKNAAAVFSLKYHLVFCPKLSPHAASGLVVPLLIHRLGRHRWTCAQRLIENDKPAYRG
jgi:hypothetical protein